MTESSSATTPGVPGPQEPASDQVMNQVMNVDMHGSKRMQASKKEKSMKEARKKILPILIQLMVVNT